MKPLKINLLIAFFSLLSTVCFAQTQQYVGKVINQHTKKPIQGAIITLVDTKQIFITEDNGTFSFTAPKQTDIIVSHLGFEEIRMSLKNTSQNIYLNPIMEQLEELLIKCTHNINDIDVRNLTGSVVTLDMNKLSERSEIDMAKLLQGQIPGLTVNYGGELGKKPEIRIRGNSSFNYKGSANEPLFVMDGIIISTETFLTLTPNDFTTIKVLKDAPATALYGIKAANGVIELTSKQGFEGKPIFSFSMKQGVTFRGERPVEMMGTNEKLAFEERIEMLATPGYLFSEKYITKNYQNSPLLQEKLAEGNRILDSLKQYNTDWFKELIKPNHFQSYNFSVRGGTEKNTYFYSLNYSKQGGRIPGNDIHHITARANLNYLITDNFNLAINNSFGVATANTQNGMDNDPTSLAYILNPYETKESKKLYSFNKHQSYKDLINQFYQKSTTKRFSSSLVMQWDVLPELNISGVIGADYSLGEINKRIYSTAYSQRDNPINAQGYLSEEDNKNFDFSSNIRASYQKQIGDHDFFIGVNSDYYLSNIKSLSASGYGIADDINSISGINNSLTGTYAPNNGGNKIKNAQLGFGAALGYTFQNTYDFYASIKRDGSSLLPSNNRWNNAWATGIAWSPSEYAFFAKQDILTALKFKASLGYTASMVGITPRDITTTFSNSNNFYGESRILQLLALPNKDLKPQQTYSTNFTIDFGFLNRFNLTTTLYNELTKEAIVTVPIASSNGFKTFTKNIGELENKGIELMLNGDVLHIADFKWNSSISMSYNANKVKKLYGTDKIYLTDQSVIPEYEVGKPLGVIYGLRDNGVYPITGLPQYVDNDGQIINFENSISPNYFNNLGYSIAPYSGFFNNYFSYKNWSLTVNINYSSGGKATYSKSYIRDNTNANKNAIKGQLDNMWFEIGDENKLYPAKKLPSSVYDLYQYPTTKTIYKTDYIKLNFVQLGYSITQSAFINRYFKSLQVNVQADNIYTYRRQKDKGSLNDVLQPILTFSINATF
ncbi:SusC/RagA family TonB-linked outer membrane protein [Myroides phaeus]|uniref:TonB-linked outer membrane protein, SusC/RagA family n=1 Tax=Myroides phaeus TaxID=702745 RepID=A0A1G8EZ12_9FLAO|nr:SusC/RagA family TonB-linked outer membrane protein [Myroides phaeus]SDH75141.1 TonB-linked outer membrane protein, SusC/RagA family [Myroides phaeus]